jgi:hypothetical protein
MALSLISQSSVFYLMHSMISLGMAPKARFLYQWKKFCCGCVDRGWIPFSWSTNDFSSCTYTACMLS